MFKIYKKQEYIYVYICRQYGFKKSKKVKAYRIKEELKTEEQLSQ